MNHKEKLYGSWNAAISTPDQGTFPALLTFSADGSVIADESPLPFETSGHGNWVMGDDGEVAFTFIALLGSQEGKNSGKIKVVGELQFDVETAGLKGRFKVEVFDTSGQVTFTDRGTHALTRIEIEALD